MRLVSLKTLLQNTYMLWSCQRQITTYCACNTTVKKLEKLSNNRVSRLFYKISPSSETKNVIFLPKSLSAYRTPLTPTCRGQNKTRPQRTGLQITLSDYLIFLLYYPVELRPYLDLGHCRALAHVDDRPYALGRIFRQQEAAILL